MMVFLLIAVLLAVLAEFKFFGGSKEVTMTNILDAIYSNTLKKTSEFSIGFMAYLVAFPSL